MSRTQYDLEDRLVDFGVSILDMVDALPTSKGANHLGGQILRSGTSPALNYGEAQSAESTKDFIHKMKVILKELRETRVCLKMISKAKSIETPPEMASLMDEVSQLIAIFYKSINTAVKNSLKNK